MKKNKLFFLFPLMHFLSLTFPFVLPAYSTLLEEKVENATIFIVADSDKMYGFGSGFIVAQGVIITNAHVVDKFQNFLVMNKKIPPTSATLMALDASDQKDFALLKFTPPSQVHINPLTFTTQFHTDEAVSAWGYPYQIAKHHKNFNTLLAGKQADPPSAISTSGNIESVIENKVTTIIHSAPLEIGNSGGPLVNTQGEVVGINTWGSKENSKNFINAALISKDIIQFLKKYGLEPIVTTSHSTSNNSELTNENLP